MLNQNFRMKAGNTRTLTVTVRDDDGALVDLTGATIEWSIARTPKDSAEATKTLGSGITCDAPTTAVFVITIDSATSADLCGNYYHRARVTDAAGRTVTVMSGRGTIDPDIE